MKQYTKNVSYLFKRDKQYKYIVYHDIYIVYQ